MRLAWFAAINFVTALLFGIHAYANGHGAGWIILTVIAVLVVLQLSYVCWLVAVSILRGARHAPTEPPQVDGLVGPRRRGLSSVQNGPDSPAG